RQPIQNHDRVYAWLPPNSVAPDGQSDQNPTGFPTVLQRQQDLSFQMFLTAGVLQSAHDYQHPYNKSFMLKLLHSDEQTISSHSNLLNLIYEGQKDNS